MRLHPTLIVAIAVGVPSVAFAVDKPDPTKLAAVIDARVSAEWKKAKTQPAKFADDATFVRRVYLDLVGRIPTVAEVRIFLSDTATDKRAKLVNTLLDSPAHAEHVALLWRREWIPQIDTPQFASLAEEIDAWLAIKFRERTAYDALVRMLLTSPRLRTVPAIPTTFLTASENKPENLAANTTRAFLGVNLDCAQCHDHPFARWTREQFWETAAFFLRPTEKTRPEITIPGTKRTLGPRLLNGSEPSWPQASTPDTGRMILAGWVTSKDNPYFAKNAVNRVWAQLFGTALVEPLDDLSGENPASHPELLDDLAKAFAESGFDLKYLTTAIMLTKAYQLSSVGVDASSENPRLFARSLVRGLTGEQLYDSLRVAAGLPTDREATPRGLQSARKQFADKFRIERAGTAQRSILHSLSLMNGKFTVELTDSTKAPTLRAVAGAPFLDEKGKIESLYLAALGRKPTADELAPLVKYLEKGGADNDAAKALADIFWALLNSSDFNTNH